jgi:hypothetical protein
LLLGREVNDAGRVVQDQDARVEQQGAVFDGSFTEDQEALLNFLYQSVGKVTQVAKQIVASHYGRRPTSRTSSAARPADARR